jgi:hypothetical protein
MSAVPPEAVGWGAVVRVTGDGLSVGVGYAVDAFLDTRRQIGSSSSQPGVSTSGLTCGMSQRLRSQCATVLLFGPVAW